MIIFRNQPSCSLGYSRGILQDRAKIFFRKQPSSSFETTQAVLQKIANILVWNQPIRSLRNSQMFLITQISQIVLQKLANCSLRTSQAVTQEPVKPSLRNLPAQKPTTPSLKPCYVLLDQLQRLSWPDPGLKPPSPSGLPLQHKILAEIGNMWPICPQDGHQISRNEQDILKSSLSHAQTQLTSLYHPFSEA